MLARSLVVVGLLATSVLAAPAGLASHTDGCQPEHATPDTTIRDLAVFLEPTVLEWDEAPATLDAHSPTAVLVYRETNGLDGIQRDDVLVDNDTCGHGSDQLVLATGCSQILGVSTGDDPGVAVEEMRCPLALPGP